MITVPNRSLIVGSRHFTEQFRDGDHTYLETICFRPSLATVVPENQPDAMIFVSQPAVWYGATYIVPNTPLFAIGPKTKQALLEKIPKTVTVQVSDHPPYNSESCLETVTECLTPLADKHIWILRGKGGRAFLGEALTRQGAHIRHLAVYERFVPMGLAAQYAKFQTNKIESIVAGSKMSLHFLVDVLRAQEKAILLSKSLFAYGQSVVNYAKEIGFRMHQIQVLSEQEEPFD